MNTTSWIDPNLFALVTLGLGGFLLGLPGLLQARKRQSRQCRFWSLPVILAILLVGFSGAAACWRQPLGIWLPPLLLGGTQLAIALLGSNAIQSLVGLGVQWLRKPRIVGLIVILTGLGSAVLWAQSLSVPENLFIPVEDVPQLEWASRLEDLPTGTARTDKGQPLLLKMAIPDPAFNEKAWLAKQTTLLSRHGLMERVIKVETGSPSANCHGWVFTGGRYWVPCEEVDTILQDNGYQKVMEPQAGDVAVYRDSTGFVAHTGLVWAIRGLDQVLIESKWGKMGVFLHPALVHPYENTTCSYYRTTRGSNLLTGFDSDSINTDHRYQRLFTPPLPEMQNE